MTSPPALLPLEGRRVALVGGAGFIGHHLALALARQGACVHIVDSLRVNNLLGLRRGGPDAPAGELSARILQDRLGQLRAARIPLIVQDARDRHALARRLRRIEPQTIVHLAAVAHAQCSNEDPHRSFDHGLRTLENALDFARCSGIEHFVYLSSSMVYGDFLAREVDEEHPLRPLGIYGALKLAGEKMVIAHQQAFGLPYTIVRPSALYGPGCVSRRVGQVFIESALSGRPLRIAGDGGERLDFTSVEDLVRGLVLVLRNPAARDQTFNLTYGQARPLRDLVAIIEQAFPDLRVEHGPRDRLMPVRGTLSIGRARTLLGYAPETPIEVGFPKYIRWYRDLVRNDRPALATCERGVNHRAWVPTDSWAGGV
jgi:nucleoside-diphosphate-sugar epimerase